MASNKFVFGSIADIGKCIWVTTRDAAPASTLKLKRGILTKPSWVKGDAQCYGVRKRNVHRRIAAPRDALGISALERKEGAKSRNSPDQTWKTGRLATILGFRRKTKTGRFPETDVKSGVSFDDQCKSRYRPSRSCVKV
ncbi:hypothetical protein BST61_g3661 [Cercospora zeina]